MAIGFYSWWGWSRRKCAHKTKKERKAELRELRYKKVYEKWLSEEPSKWRIIKHMMWWFKEPKMEG